jgi:hypothetical protein
MTYWLILFQVEPVPLGAPGPIRLKINRAKYEVVMQDERARVDCSKGAFLINEKLTFTMPEEDTLYCVCKTQKIST